MTKQGPTGRNLAEIHEKHIQCVCKMNGLGRCCATGGNLRHSLPSARYSHSEGKGNTGWADPKAILDYLGVQRCILPRDVGTLTLAN